MKASRINVFLFIFAAASLAESEAEAWYGDYYRNRAYYYSNYYGYDYGYGWHHQGYRHWHNYGPRWSYWHPSLYRDYYPYYLKQIAPANVTVIREAKAALPKDEACNSQMALLKENEALIQKEGSSIPLAEKSASLKDSVLAACVPGWMQKAAGMEKRESQPAKTELADSKSAL